MEGRKPKADPMDKRNAVVRGPTHLSRTVGYVTTCRPYWSLQKHRAIAYPYLARVAHVQ